MTAGEPGLRAPNAAGATGTTGSYGRTQPGEKEGWELLDAAHMAGGEPGQDSGPTV